MEFWIDTVNPKSVKEIKELGLLNGVTTNPSLLSTSRDHKATLNDLLDSFEGPLAVQVNSSEASLMIEEAKALYDFSDRIIVKIPVMKEGLKAIAKLSTQNIPTMATCVFTAEQALLAAKAGADYVALYLNRLERTGGDAAVLLEKVTRMFGNYQIETKILAASIASPEQIDLSLEFGIEAITLNEAMYDQLLENYPLTIEAVEHFKASFKAQDASLFKPAFWV